MSGEENEENKNVKQEMPTLEKEIEKKRKREERDDIEEEEDTVEDAIEEGPCTGCVWCEEDIPDIVAQTDSFSAMGSDSTESPMGSDPNPEGDTHEPAEVVDEVDLATDMQGLDATVCGCWWCHALEKYCCFWCEKLACDSHGGIRHYGNGVIETCLLCEEDIIESSSESEPSTPRASKMKHPDSTPEKTTQPMASP